MAVLKDNKALPVLHITWYDNKGRRIFHHYGCKGTPFTRWSIRMHDKRLRRQACPGCGEQLPLMHDHHPDG